MQSILQFRALVRIGTPLCILRIICLIQIICIATVGCDKGDPERPPLDSDKGDQFMLIDLGIGTVGEDVTKEFVVHTGRFVGANEAESEWRLDGVSKSCSCTTLDIPRESFVSGTKLQCSVTLKLPVIPGTTAATTKRPAG